MIYVVLYTASNMLFPECNTLMYKKLKWCTENELVNSEPYQHKIASHVKINDSLYSPHFWNESENLKKDKTLFSCFSCMHVYLDIFYLIQP